MLVEMNAEVLGKNFGNELYFGPSASSMKRTVCDTDCTLVQVRTGNESTSWHVPHPSSCQINKVIIQPLTVDGTFLRSVGLSWT